MAAPPSPPELAEPLPSADSVGTAVFAKIRVPAAARFWVHKTMLDATGTVVAGTGANLRVDPHDNHTFVDFIVNSK